jgi:hypothetical protein
MAKAAQLPRHLQPLRIDSQQVSAFEPLFTWLLPAQAVIVLRGPGRLTVAEFVVQALALQSLCIHGACRADLLVCNALQTLQPAGGCICGK